MKHKVMHHKKKKPIALITLGILCSILFILVIIQFVLYSTLSKDYTNFKQESLNNQNQLNSKLDTSISNLNSKINSNSIENQEERLILQMDILKNLETLENSLDQKTLSLESNLSAQIQDVDSQLQTLEDRDEELEDSLNSIQVEASDFSSIIEEVKPAVLSIKTDNGQGSGFYFDDEGYIMTNFHVIEDANTIQVINSEGQIISAELIGTASGIDLAVLKVEVEKPVEFLRFEGNVNVGEQVIALGNPLGLSFTVTQGIISATERQIDSTGIGYIQTDVPINGGNSGGPLISSQGEVVGINTFKISSTEGLGFAIPSDVAEEIANQAR